MRSNLLGVSARRMVAVVAATVLALGSSVAAEGLDTPASGTPEGAMSEVGQLPLLDPDSEAPVVATSPVTNYLVLDPAARRAYEVFADRVINNAFGTVIWAFDLDTLEPIRRVELAGFRPVVPGGAEVVHAVDDSGGRVFVVGQVAAAGGSNAADVTVVAVIDEEKLSTGATDFVRYLQIPADQAASLRLGASNRSLANLAPVYGMTFIGNAGQGKLALLFGSAAKNLGTQVYDHYLVQWDVATGNGDWIERLEACQRAPLIDAPSFRYQLAILATERALYVGCQVPSGISRIAQAVRIALDVNGRPDLTDPTRQRGVALPRVYANTIADRGSQRLLFQAELNGSTWWVFDAPTEGFVGALGLTQWDGYDSSAGLDPATGRLYVLAPDHLRLADGVAVQGGFQYSDIRLTPAPQFKNQLPSLAYPGAYPIRVDPASDGRPTRVFVMRGGFSTSSTIDYPDPSTETPKPTEPFYRVITDTVPVGRPSGLHDLDTNTVGVPEAEGVTAANFDASGAGYGFRTLLVGGADAASSRLLDQATVRGSCFTNDRELVVGQVEATKLTNLQVSALGRGLSVDEATKVDLESPGSRCSPFGPAPALDVLGRAWDENGDGKDDYTSQCVGDGEQVASPDRPGRAYRSSSTCEQAEGAVETESSGALALPGPLPVSVGEGYSKVNVVLSADAGIVTSVESTSRSIRLGGVGTIGSVRTVATSESRGLKGTAKTTFDRTICGVDLPTFAQARCLTDEQEPQFVQALNAALGQSGRARLREPDREYAKGSPGGYAAAIRRDRSEAFSDEFVSRDKSAAVPGLEIVFYRGDDPADGAGRQIFQFAGVQAASSYGIYCLRGEQTNEQGKRECIEPPLPDPANLKLVLTDDGDPAQPLSGGLFKVYSDDDRDGLLDEIDELIDGGTCLTTADGTGGCEFGGLAAGDYVVEQVKAPAGYQAAETFAVELLSGNTTVVRFKNLLAVGIVSLRLTDDSGSKKPLAGGVFEVYADDGDEAKDVDDLRYATCTTDERGNCRMALDPGAESIAPDGEEPVVCLEASGACLLAVPLGPYVVHQTAAPAGYDAAKDVGFSLDQPGDLATLSFTNGLTALPGTEGAAPVAAPEAEPEPEPELAVEPTPDIPAMPAVPPTETVVIDPGVVTPQPIVSTTPIDRGGGVVREVLRLPGKIIEKGAQGLKLLLSSPRELGLMAAVWLLVWAPCYLGERRRLAARSTLGTGVAS